MAITIDYSDGVTPEYIINIPKLDMTDVTGPSPTEIRQLNINSFRLELADLMDDTTGMAFPTIFNHTQPLTIAAVTLARVVEILVPYVIEFEDGLYNVNVVGGNSNISDRVVKNQVGVNTANSAGLTYSKEVEDQSFTDSRIWLDTVNGQPGTQFPIGTPGTPVDNLTDAQAIIAARSLPKRIFLRGDLTISAVETIADYDIEGASPRLASITVATGGGTNNLVVSALAMTGDMSGNVTASNTTSLSNLDDFDGKLKDVGLSGTITLGGGGAEHNFIDCYSEVAGTSTPIIDCANIPSLNVNIRRYSGGIRIENFKGPSNMTIDMAQGSVTLGASCSSNGTVVVRGVADITDENGPGEVIVVRAGLSSSLVWEEPVPGSPVSGSYGKLADDTKDVVDSHTAPINQTNLVTGFTLTKLTEVDSDLAIVDATVDRIETDTTALLAKNNYLTATQQTWLMEIWRFLGLEEGGKLTITDTSITVEPQFGPDTTFTIAQPDADTTTQVRDP